ncbi:MAG: response regulator [Bacillota bacterium]
MEPIKILIVDDVANTREDIRRLLFFEEDIKVIGEADDGTLAVASAEDLRPDIVLMDVNLPEVDGITATELITSKVPESAVIIISIQGEQEYIRKAMAAGASDYLVKPFSGTELASTIRRVYDKHKQRQVLLGAQVQGKMRREGRIIVPFTTRGGTGRTLISGNLAAALAQAGKKVALVALDGGKGDMEVLLNIKPKRNISDLIDEAAHDVVVLEHFLVPHLTGIKVLAGPSSEDLDLITPDGVTNALNLLAQRFTYVVVDLATNLDAVAQAVFNNADVLLLITVPEVIAVKHARTCYDYFTDMGLRDRVHYILNRANIDGGIKTAELERVLNDKFIVQIPNDEKTVISSINKGLPFMVTHPGSKITDSFRNLVRALETQISEEPQQPANKVSLVSRLFSL